MPDCPAILTASLPLSEDGRLLSHRLQGNLGRARGGRRFWRLVVSGLCLLAVASPARAQLAEDVLKKVKHGTVHIQVKTAASEDTEGTGWFVDRGFIITNAHVLNMHGADKRFPSKLEVTVDSGEPTSRTYTAKFRGADYDVDLMLLEVNGDPQELPEPLVLKPDPTLNETQNVYVFGFPLGKSLGKSITVGKSSISSLRKENGELREIQISGGINAGNSGGPVVSESGEVLGVAVSKMAGTDISFAIPGEKVLGLVWGRWASVSLDQAYLEGTNIQIPVSVRILDPLSRMTKVQLEYWTTPDMTGKVRPGSWTRPEPVEGDSPLQVLDLPNHRKTTPRGDLIVPQLPDEKSAYWIRATVVDGLGRQYWSPTIANYRPVTLQRQEVTLQFKSTPGVKRPVEIVNDSAFRFQVGTRKQTVSMHVRAIAIPTLQAADGEGDIAGSLRYKEISLGLRENGEPVKMKEKTTPLMQNFLKTSATVRYSNDGAMVYAKPELRNSNKQYKDELVAISDIVLQALELASLPLPSHELKPKDRIRLQRMLLVGLPEMYVPTHADVKYVYLGTRNFEGREAAHFDLAGSLRPRRGDDNQVTGSINGTLDIALDTGEVLRGNASMSIEYDLPGGSGVRMIGQLSMIVRPGPALTPDKQPAEKVADSAEKPEAKPETKPAATRAGEAKPENPPPAEERPQPETGASPSVSAAPGAKPKDGKPEAPNR